MSEAEEQALVERDKEIRSIYFDATSFESGFTNLLKIKELDINNFSKEGIIKLKNEWNFKNRHRKIKEILD